MTSPTANAVSRRDGGGPATASFRLRPRTGSPDTYHSRDHAAPGDHHRAGQLDYARQRGNHAGLADGSLDEGNGGRPSPCAVPRDNPLNRHASPTGLAVQSHCADCSCRVNQSLSQARNLAGSSPYALRHSTTNLIPRHNRALVPSPASHPVHSDDMDTT